VNNATIGLMVALRQMGVTRVSEVITTPFSFVATAHSILWADAQPVFVDIDPVTLNIDARKIEAQITGKTKAILAVHCYGNPCDVEAIEEIAARHRLKVIYDAAHAFGVRYKERSVLNYGDLSVLSFHATKVFNTFEGGAVISQDLETKLAIDRLCNFGIIDEVTVAHTGLNAKMSEFNAALGLLQLNHVDEAIRMRAELDAQYRHMLGDIPGIRCVSPFEDGSRNYYSFPILVEPEFPLARDSVYERLREHNIYARRYFFPLISNMPTYASMASANPSKLPIANTVASQILCLPLFPDLPRETQGRIADILRSV
jgi:dTDP-4-amino-4,6-dideoxygalactose transaminase